MSNGIASDYDKKANHYQQTRYEKTSNVPFVLVFIVLPILLAYGLWRGIKFLFYATRCNIVLGYMLDGFLWINWKYVVYGFFGTVGVYGVIEKIAAFSH